MEGMIRQMACGSRKSRIIEMPIPKYSDDEMMGHHTDNFIKAGIRP